MELIEDQTEDAGRRELAEAGDGQPPRRISPRTALALGVAAASACALALAWWSSRPAERAALAVQPSGTEPALRALAAAGIRAESRDGLLWVPAADAARAAALAAPGPAPNAVAAALEGESVFASGESSRARRTAAVIRELEASIAMQPGVERASVVVGESARPAAPGTSGGSTASVTVRMRSGAMPDDLVDAVAALVAGACPGMRPESVAIVDAGAGRVRTIRGAGERALAAARRTREEQGARLASTALAHVPGASVRVTETDGGALVAEVALPRGFVEARAAATGSPDLVAALAGEREALRDSVAPVLEAFGGCPATVTVSVADTESAPLRTERTPAEAALAMQAERTLPLGPAPGREAFPFGWAVVAAFGLAGAAWFAWRRPAGAPHGAAEPSAAPDDESMPDFDGDPLPGAEASEAVRAAPAAAAGVLRRWLDAGFEELAARLVVALDAAASASVLRALPVAHVERVTEALGSMEDVSREDLADAVESFLAEFHGPGGFGPAAEAA